MVEFHGEGCYAYEEKMKLGNWGKTSKESLEGLKKVIIAHLIAFIEYRKENC